MKYKDALRHPLWQRKRLEILSRDKWECKICGDNETTLNVHHTYYERNLMPWEYADDSLITLCEHCHEAVTENPSVLSRAKSVKPKLDCKINIDLDRIFVGFDIKKQVLVKGLKAAKDPAKYLNSHSVFIEVLHAPNADPFAKFNEWTRTKKQVRKCIKACMAAGDL